MIFSYELIKETLENIKEQRDQASESEAEYAVALAKSVAVMEANRACFVNSSDVSYTSPPNGCATVWMQAIQQLLSSKHLQAYIARTPSAGQAMKNFTDSVMRQASVEVANKTKAPSSPPPPQSTKNDNSGLWKTLGIAAIVGLGLSYLG